MSALRPNVPADVRTFAALAVKSRHKTSRRGWPLLNVHSGLGRSEIQRRMRLYWRTDWPIERLTLVIGFMRDAGAVAASSAGGFVVVEWSRVEALAGRAR